MTSEHADTINHEACVWIAKLHDTEPSPRELAALREWMRRSPAHAAELRRMARRWEELNVLTELAVPVELSKTRKVSDTWFYVNSVGHWVASGVVAVVIVLGLTLLFWRSPDAVPGGPAPPPSYATEIGEQRRITLSDASIVMLNTNSQVRVDYTGAFRNIHLMRGEAHFEVASDPDRPFRVFAGNGMVRAVGTAFSVYLKSQVVEVTVTEGTVQINTLQDDRERGGPAGGAVENLAVVNAGQSAVYDQVVESIESIQTIDRAEISRKLAWQEGLLRFSGSPLHEVIDEVSRYTPLSIVIMDPELRQQPIGGFFEVGETEKMFEALERGFGVRVERINDNVVHLSRIVPASNER